MSVTHSPYLVAASVAVIAQSIAVIRWALRSVRKDEKKAQLDRITRIFVADMARNHLPHIFRTEALLCEGINRLLRDRQLPDMEIEEHHQVQWVDLSDGNGKEKGII